MSSRKSTNTTEMIANEIIRDTMSRGGFRRLRGQGKPLKVDVSSPVLDNLDIKLNQILHNAGFAPEWITQEKDIRISISNLEKFITMCWNKCGPHPMTFSNMQLWEDYVKQFKITEKSINKKIDSFNLVVPILNRQRPHINLLVLIGKICSKEPVQDVNIGTQLQSEPAQKQTSDLLTYYWLKVTKWLFGSSQ